MLSRREYFLRILFLTLTAVMLAFTSGAFFGSMLSRREGAITFGCVNLIVALMTVAQLLHFIMDVYNTTLSLI